MSKKISVVQNNVFSKKKKLGGKLALAAAVAFVAPSAMLYAADVVFLPTVGVNGEISDPTQWTTGTVPTNTDRFDLAGGYTGSLTNNVAITVNTYYIGANNDEIVATREVKGSAIRNIDCTLTTSPATEVQFRSH